MSSLLSVQEVADGVEEYEELNGDHVEDSDMEGSDLDDPDGSQDFANDTDENQEDEDYTNEDNDDTYSESESQPEAPSTRPASRITRGQRKLLEAEESEIESDSDSLPKPSKPSRKSRKPPNPPSEYETYVRGSGPALAPIGILPENGLGGKIVRSVNHDSELLAPAAMYYYVTVPGGSKRPKQVMPGDIRNYVSATMHESWDYVAFSTWAKAREVKHREEEKATQAELDARNKKSFAESWECSIMRTREEQHQPREKPEAIAAEPAVKRPGLSKVGIHEKERLVPYNIKPWTPPEDYESSRWSGSSDSDDIPAVAVPKKQHVKTAARTPSRSNSASRLADAEPFIIKLDGNDVDPPMPHLKELLIERNETVTSKPSRTASSSSPTFENSQQSEADVSAPTSQPPISPLIPNFVGNCFPLEDYSILFPDEELETYEVTVSNAIISKSETEELKGPSSKMDEIMPNGKGFNAKKASTYCSNLVQSPEASADTSQSFLDASKDFSYNPGAVDMSFFVALVEDIGGTKNYLQGPVDSFDQELSHLCGQDASNNSRQVETKLDSSHFQQQVKKKLSMTEVDTISSDLFQDLSSSPANPGYYTHPSTQAEGNLSGKPESFDQQSVLHHRPSTKFADISAAPAPVMVSKISNPSRYIGNRGRTSSTIASTEDQGRIPSLDQSQMDPQASIALNLNGKRSMGSIPDIEHNQKSASTWPKRP